MGVDEVGRSRPSYLTFETSGMTVLWDQVGERVVATFALTGNAGRLAVSRCLEDLGIEARSVVYGREGGAI